jgi:2-aminoadipate transaminase
MSISTHFARRTSRMKASAIRELLSVTARPDVISFAGGLPAAEILPVEDVAAATDRVLSRQGRVALQYGPTEGYVPLREQIVAQYQERGVNLSIDNILLVNGSQQGLDFVGRLFIDDGDPVLVEAPTYVGALQAWSPFAPSFVTVPTDVDGLQTDQLRTVEPFKFAYLLPNFQNPSGITLSRERREQIIPIVHDREALIVEDDPYRELRYSGQDIPSLLEIEARQLGKDWNDQGRVIHLGTFSKTLAPGLRLGWVIAPTPVIHLMVLAKQGTDLHTSSLGQMIVSELLADGVLERNLPGLRALYRERRDAMLDALAVEVGNHASWTHPDGGLFLWLKLGENADTVELLKRALEQKVAYVPGNAFYVDGRGHHEMRLNFSCMGPDRIREGIRRLATLITEPLPAR